MSQTLFHLWQEFTRQDFDVFVYRPQNFSNFLSQYIGESSDFLQIPQPICGSSRNFSKSQSLYIGVESLDLYIGARARIFAKSKDLYIGKELSKFFQVPRLMYRGKAQIFSKSNSKKTFWKSKRKYLSFLQGPQTRHFLNFFWSQIGTLLTFFQYREVKSSKNSREREREREREMRQREGVLY